MTTRAVLQTNDAGTRLAQLAKDALDECGGDRLLARDVVWRWIKGDRDFRLALVKALEQDALAEAVDLAWERDKRHLQVAPKPTGGTDRGAAGIVAMVNRTLLDYQLSNGQKLGDASPHAVLSEQLQHEAAARRNASLARWFALIHDRVQYADRVRDVLTDDALMTLRHEAEVIDEEE